MEQIEFANVILEEYSEQNYKLTLRQVYYQMVARDFIPNEVQEYAKLSRTLVIGRMNGLIDWNMIEDRIRKPYLGYAVNSIQEAIEDTVNYYKLNRQKGQEYCIEIWTEKDAVSNILKRNSSYFHVNLMVNRGYSSCSAMYEAYNRVINANEKTIILYVGDYDPSGLDMLRDIKERLEKFGCIEEESFEIIHVALTKEQIDKYNPPPNPAKITDPRARWYINKFGSNSWELDALKPEILYDLTQDAVINYLDINKFNKMLKKEKLDKKKLKELIL